MRVRRIGVMLAVCVLWTLGVSEVFGQETGAEAPRTSQEWTSQSCCTKTASASLVTSRAATGESRSARPFSWSPRAHQRAFASRLLRYPPTAFQL